MATFHLSVITPTKTLLDKEVASIIVPGVEGYLGVMANHAPLIAALGPGVFSVRDEPNGDAVEYLLGGGFLEVSNNKAILLADSMEMAGEVDVERARASEDRAKKRLAEGSSQWDIPRAEDSLARAQNRLKHSR